MLKPSDFNNAVPQFQNGNYASNPVNPKYVEEPDAENYNKGTEPLQTLPAQWWNWFLNKFTSRFNKINIYVKNIFNELAQVLSIFNITPDGTEQTPTTSQLKTVFESCYPQYVKTAACLVGTETTVNGHPLSSNVTVTKNDLGLGTAATVNTGTAVGCIPTVGTALGTTNNNILVTDASGNLKPSGITVGTAASCDATAFRPSTWTPTVVCCAKCNGSGVAFGSAATCDATAFRASTWTPSLVNCSCYNYIDSYTVSADRGVVLTCAVTAAGQYQTLGPSTVCKFTFNPATGEVKAKTFTGTLAGCACCAGRSYSVMDYCSNTTPLYVGYASTGLTCAQVSHLAAFSVNYVSGKTIIKNASKDVIKSWLGLGTAAACDASCFGVTCTFGNVVATKNPTMRTWSVYSPKSSSYEFVPECDIAKAMCWATDVFAQGHYMSITGFMGKANPVYELKCSNKGVYVIKCSADGCNCVSLDYTCNRGYLLPISISGSY